MISPERTVFETDDADFVRLPGAQGEMGVMPDHTPLLTPLAIGIIEVRRGEETEVIAAAGGFAEITPDSVSILADAAELRGEIDSERARQARERAEERLREAQRKAREIDPDRARMALLRAINRLRAAGPRAIRAPDA